MGNDTFNVGLQQLRYKRLVESASPLKTPEIGNAGYDLAICHSVILEPWKWTTVNTGIAVEIPQGYVGLVRGRSGNAFNNYVFVSDDTIDYVFVFDGTIDRNYRGEIKVNMCFQPPTTAMDEVMVFNAGDRIAQLVITPYFYGATTEVTELTETNRGNRGFGSSGV